MRAVRWVLCCVGGVLLSLAGARAGRADVRLVASLGPGAVVPPVVDAPAEARGRMELSIGPDGMVAWELRVTELTGTAVEVALRVAPAGANGAPAVLLTNPPATGTHVGTFGPLSVAQQDALFSDGWYVEVRTVAHPAGEVRGQLALAVVPDRTCNCAGAPSRAGFRACVQAGVRRMPPGLRRSSAAQSLRIMSRLASCGPAPRRIPPRTVACRLRPAPLDNVVVEPLCAQLPARRCAALDGRADVGDCWTAAASEEPHEPLQATVEPID